MATATAGVRPSRRGKTRRQTSLRGAGPFTYLSLALIGILFAAPFVWMLVTSFKSKVDAAAATPTWIPRDATTDSYRFILDQPQTPVFRWFLNSMLAATGQMLLVVTVASMAAYALSRMDFPGRGVLSKLILATLFVPPISLLIPNYVIISKLGWLDSLPAVIIPGAAGAFGVFFMRQFFQSLPAEIEEAALVDGANRWRIFWTIVVPLSRPALATLALLSFLTNWNDFLWPLYVLFSPSRLTLQPGLSTLQSAYTTDYATIMAGGVIASIPVLLLYLVSQRFVIEGVSRSGLKG